MLSHSNYCIHRPNLPYTHVPNSILVPPWQVPIMCNMSSYTCDFGFKPIKNGPPMYRKLYGPPLSDSSTILTDRSIFFPPDKGPCTIGDPTIDRYRDVCSSPCSK